MLSWSHATQHSPLATTERVHTSQQQNFNSFNAHWATFPMPPDPTTDHALARHPAKPNSALLSASLNTSHATTLYPLHPQSRAGCTIGQKHNTGITEFTHPHPQATTCPTCTIGPNTQAVVAQQVKVKQTQQSHPYTNPACVPFTIFSSSKGQMLELNFSRSNKSTMLREEIVSVSIVEINLEQVISAQEREK